MDFEEKYPVLNYETLFAKISMLVIDHSIL